MDRDNRDFRMAGVYPENPFIPAIPVQTSVSLSLVSRHTGSLGGWTLGESEVSKSVSLSLVSRLFIHQDLYNPISTRRAVSKSESLSLVSRLDEFGHHWFFILGDRGVSKSVSLSLVSRRQKRPTDRLEQRPVSKSVSLSLVSRPTFHHPPS